MTSKTPGKDVIYIDVDDEITGIIDKVKASKQKIVALVLPKRATVLQSVVNMKLLKRSSDGAKKQVVLITTEAGLLPLAGTVGIYTAKSLQSKPEIPETAKKGDDSEDEESPSAEAMGDDSEESEEAEVDKTKPVGELAGAAALSKEVDDDVIELGDDDSDSAATPAAGAPAKAGKKKNLQFKIPNFNHFRLMLVLGAVGLALLIAMYIVAFRVLPAATIAIDTNSTAVDVSAPVNLKTAPDTKLDVEQAIVPATAQSVQKTQSQQVPATGQQNNGEKATGTVTIHNCTDSSVTVPAGSGVSGGGLTFITQKTLSLSAGNFTSGGVCKSTGSHIDSTAVVAQKAGAGYNVGAQNYTVAGYSGLSANGSAMSGGTDDIIKIVTQSDIDEAKQKIGAQDANPIKQELITGLETKDLYSVEPTYKATDPQTKTSANAGDQADTVTVTQTTTFSMLGVKEADLKKVIAKAVSEKIDTKKQKILDYGLDSAQFSVQSQDVNGAALTMDITVVAGPELDVAGIKKQVAGKKAGDAVAIIKKNPGVTDVTVKYSPFWVSSIPTNTSKITVTVEKPQTKTDAKSDQP